jgi:hypothetical protein
MLAVFSVADSNDEASTQLAEALCTQIVDSLGAARMATTRPPLCSERPPGGRSFEQIVAAQVERLLAATDHLRRHRYEVTVLAQRGQKDAPGPWTGTLRKRATIGDFRAYRHLWDLSARQETDDVLHAAIGGDYLIRPDVVIWQDPVDAVELSQAGLPPLLTKADAAAWGASLVVSDPRTTAPLLHASVSCKETLRSDRAQNARTEALNLLRNRKARAPHIVLVTAEPLPSRLSSIAQGTGDVDCVYHVALPELRLGLETLHHLSPASWERERRTLNALVKGERLRDLTALALDLLT